MLKRVALLSLCLCLFRATPAHAENNYIPVAWTDLLHTLVRFNALDLANDNDLLDNYALVTDCDLYHYYFKNDFKWNQIRTMIRQSLQKDSADFPVRYHFDDKFQLDRYDFDSKLYRFTADSLIRKVGAITIFTFMGAVCDGIDLKYLPLSYKAKLNVPVSVPGIPLDPKAAEALLNYMDASDNGEHYMYARFNITIVYVEPLRKFAQGSKHDANVQYYQAHNDQNAFLMDARVDPVEFYKDREMTQLVYTYKPL